MKFVVEIWIGEEAKKPLRSVREVRAAAGRGLEGDRYFFGRGSFDRAALPAAGRAVSMIESEAVKACRVELSGDPRAEVLHGGDLRRNLVTKGVELERLVGATFRVGEAVLQGVRLAPPCRLLQRLTGFDVIRGLAGRGGLRAEILESGVIRVGDEIEILKLGRGRLPQ